MTLQWDAVVGRIGPLPKLDGALCSDRATLFDPPPETDRDDLEYCRSAAVRLCRQCPALSDCHSWFVSLAALDRPPGVVAGLVNGEDPPPPWR